MSKKCALLTCEALFNKKTDNVSGFVTDDHLLVEPLKELGFETEFVVWSAPTDWQKYDCAVIRTTWDYISQSERYLKALKEIDQQTRLLNPFSVVQWNIQKDYLLELAEKGIETVSTQVIKAFDPDSILDYIKENRASGIVIKPIVGAGAINTFFLTAGEVPAFDSKKIQGRFLLQPFMESIREGEISVIYFGGKLSHAIKKVPKKGDYRSQEEYGSAILPYTPSAKELAFCETVLKAIPEPGLYARIDFLSEGLAPLLMEVELIEPSLYFRTDPGSPRRFGEALKSIF